MDVPWQFHLLGRLNAQRGDLTVTRFASSRIAALLARLALFPRRAHAREELIELLWPESELDAGRLSLRVALASLRRQLEPPDVAPGSILIADRSILRLNPIACRCDVADFEAALKTAARASSPQGKREALDQAIALYTGELLPGFYDDWIIEERERLTALYEEAYEQLHDLPAATLVSILAVANTETAPGQPRLHGFPLQFTRFFGRELEGAQIGQWLHSPQTRLVTLTGPGGAGKTRLAVQTAQQAAPAFAGPVCFVSLADLSDPELIPDAIAQTLGLTRSAGLEPLDQIAAALAAQPPALLVLDNFEQLVTNGAPTVFSLMCRVSVFDVSGDLPPPPVPAGRARVSRSSLTAAGGGRDAGTDFPGRRRPAYLWTGRRPPGPTSSSRAATPQTVADLCRSLEGLPLAIELVAARAQALTPAQMGGAPGAAL